MKYSLRKSFSFRRRKTKHDDDDEQMCTNVHSTSHSSLVEVFEPRRDEDEHDQPLPSTTSSRKRPFDRLASQIRQSFRNSLRRQRPRLESTNSNKRLIHNPNEDHQTHLPTLYPPLSTGLSCPLTEIPQLTPSVRCPTVPLPPPTEDHQSAETPPRRTLRKHFSFRRKEPSEDKDSKPSLTLTQRFHSLRRSFRSTSSSKPQHYLLANE